MPRRQAEVPVEPSSSKEELARLAASMILEASSLTDELTDAEARPLIAWALLQGEAAAGAVEESSTLAGPDPADSGEVTSPPVRDAAEMVAQQVAPLRRCMRAINALAGERRELAPEQAFEKLEALWVAAQELPAPPVEAETGAALAELAAQLGRLDTLAFVEAVLDLLGPAPAEEVLAERERGDEGQPR